MHIERSKVVWWCGGVVVNTCELDVLNHLSSSRPGTNNEFKSRGLLGYIYAPSCSRK